MKNFVRIVAISFIVGAVYSACEWFENRGNIPKEEDDFEVIDTTAE